MNRTISNGLSLGYHNPNCLLAYLLAIPKFLGGTLHSRLNFGDLSNYAETEILTRVLSESSQSQQKLKWKDHVHLI